MQKNENTLNEVLIAIQEPSFGGFSAPIVSPSARFFFASSHSNHN